MPQTILFSLVSVRGHLVDEICVSALFMNVFCMNMTLVYMITSLVI